MPGFSGIKAARAVRELDKAAAIGFFTSSPEFALEGCSVRAANCILKPFTREKLFSAFNALFEPLPQKGGEDALVVVFQSQREKKPALGRRAGFFYPRFGRGVNGLRFAVKTAPFRTN